MANTKSQIKRIGTNEKQRQRNVAFKSSVKTAIKKAKLAIENKDLNNQELVNNANKLLDKCVNKKIYHKNKVARLKSKLALL